MGDKEVVKPDGVYIEVFCMKDGQRYNLYDHDMKTVSCILTDAVMDGVAKIIGVDTTTLDTNNQTQEVK